MIQIRNASKIYNDNHENTVTALDNINLDLPDRGIIIITGTSGCGKTTLLNLLGGFDEATNGSILVDNEDISKFNEKQWDKYRSEKIGFIFQNYSLLEDLTVRENIELPLVVRGVPKQNINEKVSSIAEKFGMETLLDKNAKHLSGGQKQRVAILRAVLKNPSIILADEPTGNLDRENSKLIFDMLKEFSQNCLVVVVTHDAELAEKYADRLISLSYGSITKDVVYNENSDLTRNSEETDEKNLLNRNSLPFGYCLGLAGNLLKKRAARAVITIIILLITISFAMIIISVIGANKAKTISNYLEKNNQKYASVYQHIDATDAAFTGNTVKRNETGEKIYKLLCEAVGKENIVLCDNATVETKYLDEEPICISTDIFVLDEDSFENLRSDKEDYADTYEIVINETLAKGLNLQQLDESKKITLSVDGTRNIRIVGIIPDWDDLENEGIYCTEDLYRKLKSERELCFAGINIVSRSGVKGYTTEISMGTSDNYSDKIVYGRLPEKATEFALSSQYFNNLGNDWNKVNGKQFSCYDLYDEKYKNAFYDCINLYDFCGETMTLVGVVDSAEDIIFSGELYKSIVAVSDKYGCGYVVKDSTKNWHQVSQKLLDYGFYIDDSELEKVYTLWENLEGFYTAAFVCLVALIGLSLFQMISLFSFSIKDSSYTIGTLVALGVPMKNISLIFVMESVVTTVTSLVLSVIATLAGVGWLNSHFISTEKMDEKITTIIANPGWVVLAGIILFLIAVTTVLIPLRKMKTTSVVKLLMRE